MQPDLDIARYIALLKRRSGVIALITLLGLIATMFYVLSQTPQYRACATIQVRSPAIPHTLASPVVLDGVAERLESTRQRLMTPQALAQTAAKFGLFADDPGMSDRDRAGLIASSTEIYPLTYRQGHGGGQITSFQIAYIADDPQLAADVANEFVSIVVQENERERMATATVTREFFRGQLEAATRDLNAIEAEIAEFKRQNDEQLPDTLGLRRETIAKLSDQRFEIELRIAELERRRGVLNQRLDDESFWETDVVETSAPRTPLQQQLFNLQLEMKSKLSIFSEEHPDMRALATRIELLEAAVAREDVGADEVEDDTYSFAQRRARAELRDAIDTASAEIQTLKRRLSDIDARETPFTSSIAQTPEIERQMNSLLRRKEGLQARYDEAVVKLAKAELGEILEQSSQAERFEVIEWAEAPASHFKPKRKLIVLAGVMGSLGLALALVLGLDLINTTIRSDEDFYRQLDAHPFAMVPYYKTGRDRFKAGFGMVAGVAFTASTLFVAGYVVDRYFLPLDPYFERVYNDTNLIHAMSLMREQIGENSP
ncbi:MAG: Wzz/FepE/Etk N-terminal domain-containing protein [Pseudomonadota bacterium]